MNDIEPHVGAPLVRILVVLNQRIQKHRRGKTVVQSSSDQFLADAAFGEADVVVGIAEECAQLVICAERRPADIRMFVAGIKPARRPTHTA